MNINPITDERFESFEEAASYCKHYAPHLIPADAGPYVWPRYSVVEPPKVGDLVSYGFNGDAYPCGFVTKISKSLRRVETSEGRVFFRRKLTGSWISGGTWSLIHGHVNKRNPSF